MGRESEAGNNNEKSKPMWSRVLWASSGQPFPEPAIEKRQDNAPDGACFGPWQHTLVSFGLEQARAETAGDCSTLTLEGVRHGSRRRGGERCW